MDSGGDQFVTCEWYQRFWICTSTQYYANVNATAANAAYSMILLGWEFGRKMNIFLFNLFRSRWWNSLCIKLLLKKRIVNLFRGVNNSIHCISIMQQLTYRRPKFSCSVVVFSFYWTHINLCLKNRYKWQKERFYLFESKRKKRSPNNKDLFIYSRDCGID